MNKWIVVFLFMIHLQAISWDDIINSLIYKGENQVIRDLKAKLESQNFWQERISNKNVEFGLYPKEKYLILASKKTKQINIYNVHNDIKHIDKIDALFGKVQGDKKIEGDLKTPIGVYDFISKLSKDTKLEERYGPLAFTSSYPNLIDKNIFKKTGYGIWLHGKPLDNTNKIDTKGCISIDNARLIDTNKNIDYKKTVLVIARGELARSNIVEISTILSNIYAWKHAWESSNFNKYISYYNAKFKRFDNQSLRSFSRFKRNIFRKGQKKTILFKDIEIIPYYFADNEKYFRIRFFEEYRSPSYNFKGNKELYVSLNNKTMSILVEK